MKLFSTATRASIQALDAANKCGAQYTAVWWPVQNEIATCDQNLMLTVASGLLSAHSVTSSIDPNPSAIIPPAVSVHGVDTPQTQAALTRHLERVSAAVLDVATHIVNDIERVGRLVTEALVGSSAVKIRHAIVREILRESGLDKFPLAQACDLVDAIANQVVGTPAAVSAPTVDPIAGAPAQPMLTPAPTADGQPVKSAAKKTRKPKPAADAVVGTPAAVSAPAVDPIAGASAQPMSTPPTPAPTADGQPVKSAAKKTRKPKPAADAVVGMPAAVSAPAVDPIAGASAQSTRVISSPPMAPDSRSGRTSIKAAASPATAKSRRRAETPKSEQPAIGDKAAYGPDAGIVDQDAPNPDSEVWEACERSIAGLADRPHMRVNIFLWKPVPKLAYAHQADVLHLVEQTLAADFCDFYTVIWPTPVATQSSFYVEVSGISDPAERARWRHYVENVVAAAIRAAKSYYARDDRRLLPSLDLLMRAA